MDVSRYIETANGSPAVKWGLLVSTIVGALLRSYWLGFIQSVRAYGDGLGNQVSGLQNFVVEDLVGGLVSIGVVAIEEAFRSNAAWIEGLGTVGIVVATVEIAVMFLILAWTFDQVVSKVRRTLG